MKSVARPKPSSGTGSPQLVLIQVLRGVAALAVALVHLEPEVLGRGGSAAAIRAFPWEAGVDVFFVISGFVMVYASGALFGQAGSVRTFLARRLARIAPLYWLTTTLVLAVLAIRPDLMRSAVATPGLALASYLFVPWPRPDGIVQPVYTLGWTLNYEMFFYAVFALALPLAAGRAVAVVSATLFALVAAGLAFGPLPQPLGFWTGTLLVEFAFGMWLGLARLQGITLAPALRLALAGLGLALFALAGRDAVSARGLDQALLFALPSACLVAACGLGPAREAGHDAGRPSWPTRIGIALGAASYAIYLLHPFAIRATIRTVDAAALGPLLGPTGVAALALAAAIALALAVHRWIERPLTRSARRILETRQPGGG